MTKSLSRWQFLVIAGVLLSAGVTAWMCFFPPASDALHKVVSNHNSTLQALFAGVCCLAYARLAEHPCRSRCAGWLLIGWGCVSWGIGQGFWTYYECWAGVEAPFPAWSDLGFLGACPLLIGGVMLLFGSVRMTGRARLLLDSALVTASVAVLSWYYLVRQLWHQSDLSLLAKGISVAYPLCDIAALFGALVLWRGAAGDPGQRRSFGCLAAGLVLIAASDTLFVFTTFHGTYKTGHWLDLGWDFGWPLIGFAALLPLWWPTPAPAADDSAPSYYQAVATPRTVGLLAPYLLVFLAAVLVVSEEYVTNTRLSLSIFLVGAFLNCLVIFRQVFTLLENQHLTLQLRSFTENLEHVVRRRTHQLTALQGLTRAVNSSREEAVVLEATAAHSREAFNADAVALWLLEGDTAVARPVSRLRLHQGLEAHPDVLPFLEAQPVSEQIEMRLLPTTLAAGERYTSTLLCAPLRWQQQVIGAVGVIRWNDSFERSEPELLESIGIEAGTALENARRYTAALEAADRDSVTDLLNHRAIHQRLRGALQQARERREPLAVLMIDLDNFKLFNDTYGHLVGDQVLKRAAETLTAECGEGALIARYGGDEFLVALPGGDTEAALAVAMRLRDRMHADGFQRPGEERTVPITLSFGIAAFPEDSQDRHELLTLADANLYAAKQSDDRIKSTTDTQRTHRQLRVESSFSVLDAMVTAVDNKDRYTRRHSEDVTDYALWIAEELGFSEETMRTLRIAGLLHDVGKIGVPDEILRKPGRLSAEEWEVMKRHPHLGALIIGGVPGMEAILPAVRSHHERWDGQGYPDSLSGEEIPLLGRVLAVADAVSAMTTDRPYRKGIEWELALREIKAGIGTQFDPTLARAFLRAAARHHPAPAPLLLLAGAAAG
jgi:diguanylate cyclase (GGDEF)-like protein